MKRKTAMERLEVVIGIVLLLFLMQMALSPASANEGDETVGLKETNTEQKK